MFISVTYKYVDTCEEYSVAYWYDLQPDAMFRQERIAAYLGDLLSIGFSGFRIDAAKHIKPDDLVAILTKLRCIYY